MPTLVRAMATAAVACGCEGGASPAAATNVYVLGIVEAVAVEAVAVVAVVTDTIDDSPVDGRAGAVRPSVTGRIMIVGNGLKARRSGVVTVTVTGAVVAGPVGATVAAGGTLVAGAVTGVGVGGGPVVDVGLSGMVVTVVGGARVDVGLTEVAGRTTVAGEVAGGGTMGGWDVEGGATMVGGGANAGGTMVGGDAGGGTMVGGMVAGSGVFVGAVAERLMGTTYPIGAASLPASGVTPERVFVAVVAVGLVCAVGLVWALGLVGAACVGAAGVSAAGSVGAVAGADVVGDAGPLCQATRPSGGTIIGPGPAGSGTVGAGIPTLGPAARSANGAEAVAVSGSTITGGVATPSGGRGRARLDGPAAGAFFAFAPAAWPSIAIPNDGPATTFVGIIAGRTAGLTGGSTVAGPTTTRTGVATSIVVRWPSAATAVTPPTSVMAAVPSATTLSRRRSDAVSSVEIRP